MKPHIPGRWYAQGLDTPRFTTGAEVVRHLGAVQSQLHDMALWAIGRRCGRTLSELQAEFETGAFVRTHVLRPTWHDVMLDDLWWLQSLTADRVHRLNAPQLRQHGISDDLLAEASAATPAALGDGPLTRAALGAALADLGVDIDDARMPHVAMHLETTCLVASGPMQGKQHTYRLLPPAPPLADRDTLLADVATGYARGHGAFRARDLAWWTSLTLTDARRAIELSGLDVHSIDGESYAVPAQVVEVDPPRATLLSNYDEYISYARDSTDLEQTNDSISDILRGSGLLLLDGALAGRWTRTIRNATVGINVVSATALSGDTRDAVEREAHAFGRFVERDARLTLSH
ncbi:DNA glycosylase AlkZ-like family protein [Aeromicrobium sp. CF3.5]|uniref:DNA glycosylase AlkZ-like family protein n=1 Tax=Aeromicrobium sp. CF3.5 TaxID=3373078 RepID=UPI003EE61A92